MKMTSRWFVLALAAVLAVSLSQAGEREIHPYTPGVNGVVGPQVIAETKVAPVHPEAAADKSATLTLSAVIRQDGTVADVRILDCDAPGAGFEKSAIDAVRQWRFEPGTWKGRAVDTVQKMRLRIGPTEGTASATGREATRAVLPATQGPGIATLPAGMAARTADATGDLPVVPPGKLPPILGQAAKPQPMPRAACAPGSGDCLYEKPQKQPPKSVAPLPAPTGR